MLCCIVLYCVVLYCVVLYCVVLYWVGLCCVVLYLLYCVELYCIVLYHCNMGRDCCDVDRTVEVCGLVELVEQNKLIETHRVSNLETTNQFRTQYLCDVILRRSVSVSRPF